MNEPAPNPANQFLWRPYCQMKTAGDPYEVVGSTGSRLILADGTELIDGISCWWTACHGHKHPHLVAEIKKQLDLLPHVMLGGMTHPQAQRLATRLADLLPNDLNHVFLVDSGSVAVEVAMKMAVQYWMNQGTSGRNRFVSFVDSYHGDTAGAMSVCDPVDSMHSHFKGYLLEQYPLPIPISESDWSAFATFLEQHRSHLAGVIIEPLVQAAGGFRFHTPQQLRRISEITSAHNLLLLCDEIATGFGRTGKMFAVEWADVVPDIMCIGKGLSGGMISLAATIARRHVFEAFYSNDPNAALMHGPTYMGNPLACAAANASIDLFEQEPRLEQVAAMEEICRARLTPLEGAPHVCGVRILGGFAAVQVSTNLNKRRWMEFFVSQGVWLRPTRDVFYLAPPLNVAPTDLHRLCDVLIAAVAAYGESVDPGAEELRP